MARAGLTRERVVAVAAEVADESGYPALTLAAVAARCGVALPSLYKHVDGLDGLRRDLAVLGTRELATELSRAAAGRSTRQALHSVADAYRTYARRRPGAYAASVRAPDPDDPEHEDAARELLGLAFAVLAGYGISGDDVIDATRFLRAALHGFVALEAAGGITAPRDNAASFTRMVDALDLAFRSWSTLAPPTTTG